MTGQSKKAFTFVAASFSIILGLTQVFAAGIAGTPLGVPNAPAITHVDQVNPDATTSDMKVTWTPPSVTGGTPLTGYTATATLGSSTYSCSIIPTIPTPATENCTITGLNFATTYSFTVVASNAAGTSLFSTAVSGTTPGKVQHLVVSGVPAGSSIPYGTSDFQLTAVSQDAFNAPTGLTPTWSVSSGSAGVCSIDTNGYVHILGAGTCTPLADQNGSGSPYGPAAQVASPISVTLNISSTSISTNPATNIQGSAATLNGTIPYPGANTTPTFCVSLSNVIAASCLLPAGVSVGSYSPSVVTSTSSTSVSGLASGLQQGTQYYFWIIATPVGSSAVSASSTQTFTTLSGPTLTLSGSTTGSVGTAMTLNFTASGGSGDYILWDKGTLPGGLSFTPGLTLGTFTGTPTTVGTFSTFVSVTDSLNQQATLPLTITIGASAPTPTPAPVVEVPFVPTPSPTPTPSASPTPTVKPTPSPSASPTPTPSAKPTPAPTPSPSASPSQSPVPNVQPAPVMKSVGMIRFALNTFFLYDSDKKTLRAIAAKILRSKSKYVLVYGHTDIQVGVDNTWLSEQRAKAVKAFIHPLIPDARIVVGWYAARKPLVKAKTQRAFAQNRRVEIYTK